MLMPWVLVPPDVICNCAIKAYILAVIEAIFRPLGGSPVVTIGNGHLLGLAQAGLFSHHFFLR